MYSLKTSIRVAGGARLPVDVLWGQARIGCNRPLVHSLKRCAKFWSARARVKVDDAQKRREKSSQSAGAKVLRDNGCCCFHGRVLRLEKEAMTERHKMDADSEQVFWGSRPRQIPKPPGNLEARPPNLGHARSTQARRLSFPSPGLCSSIASSGENRALAERNNRLQPRDKRTRYLPASRHETGTASNARRRQLWAGFCC